MRKNLKITIFIILFNLLYSCQTINYQKEPEKLFIDDESVCKVSGFIELNHKMFLRNPPNLFHFYILQNPERVYLKYLPIFWKMMGFSSKTLIFSNYNEIKDAIEQNYDVIIIYEKTSYFGLKRKLHASLLHQIDCYPDGSYNLFLDNLGTSTFSKLGYYEIINCNYVEFWALKPLKLSN